MPNERTGRLRRQLLASLTVSFALIAWSCSSGPTSPSPNPNPGPLTITCPAAQAITSPNGQATAVTFPAPTFSGGRAPVQVSCTPASGSVFPLGQTMVNCTATDAAAVTASCTIAVTVSAPPRLSRTSFLAFGDSFTAGEVTVPAAPNSVLVVVPSAAYPTQLGQQLRARYTAQTIQVTNSGVPGESATDGARRLPGVMASVRPEVLLLLEGVNELAAFGIPGISRAATAIETMAREGRGRGARVFMATLPPPRPGGSRSLNLAWIQALNDRIKITAAGEGAVLVDLYEAINANVNLYIGSDGLHPTEAGYIRMAETFAAAIRANLEVR